MKKMTKASLVIPVAAMAVMATNAYAFNPAVLEQAGLSDDQIAAFEAAHELREEGDRDGARDVLEDAGIDQDTMHDIRDTMKELRKERREEVKAAVEAEDYDSFLEAVEGSPLEEKINSEEDFETFVEAHELRESGDREGARELLEELGVEPKEHGNRGHGFGKKHFGSEGGHRMQE